MSLELFLTTLVAWSVQIFVLIAVATCVAITIKHPKGRLLFWQGVLLLAVLIPIVEPWRPADISLAIAPSPIATPLHATTSAPAPPVTKIPWRREYWLLIMASGAALRMLWIAAGFGRLRVYRKSARLLATPPLPFVSDAARWYASESVPGPVTYGWLRPSILLPARVLALPAALREPIACHELLHVTRRDWLFVLAEEFLRSALWFHPAIWFVLARIQLAREQVVDQEVVRLTGNRDRYLDALVAVAEQSLLSDLAPAPLFLRKRQLAVRVKQILKEVSMSRSHLAANLTGAFAVALAAACVAVWFFPFVSQAQTVADSPGVTVTAGAPLIHRSPVRTPAGVVATGTVIVDATLNSKGEVTDTRVISGPLELRRSAIESMLQWHYSPGPSQAQASISFQSVPGSQSVAQVPDLRFAPPPPPPPPPPPGASRALANGVPATLRKIEFSGISPEAERELRSRITFHEGASVTPAELMSILDTVHAYDSHLTVLVDTPPSPDGLTVSISPLAQAPPPPAPPPPPPPPPSGPQRIGGQVMQSKVISRVAPQYTDAARQAGLQGTVILNVVIDETGKPVDVTVAKSLGMGLDESAMTAVWQWRYQPPLLNNVPVQVLTSINVDFRLQ